jgi:hypothetical protein
MARGIVFQKISGAAAGALIGAATEAFAAAVRNEMEFKPLKTMHSAKCGISRP